MRKKEAQAEAEQAPPQSTKSGLFRLKKQSRQQKVPSRREWLGLKPVRNPALKWREQEGVVVIEIHRAQNWKTRLLNLVFPLPERHTVALDAIGSIVWRSVDGEVSIEQIAKILVRELQIERREAEVSLQQFLKELGRRGYIGFKMEPGAPST